MTGARTPWRDNLEALVMAVVMALLLKGFIVEAYKIPTGSMQPTLIGDEYAGIEDRILVDKLSYAIHAPERWDVAVFRYPLDHSQNFVKRVVGVGPEQFRIDYGDLWHRADERQEWRLLRRPERVQADAWKRLDLEAPPVSSWGPASGRGNGWTYEGRGIDAPHAGRAVFRGGNVSIMDRYMDGYPEEVIPHLKPSNRSSALQMVGDLRLSGVVTATPELEHLELELSEGLQRYRFVLPGPAAGPDARPALQHLELGRWRASRDEPGREEERREGDPFRLVAGQPLAFAVQNLDDRLRLDYAGHSLSLEVSPVRDQDSGVALELVGGGAALTELMVERDIYYLGQNRQQVDIPADHYFMLGDNTQDSSDGREWKFWNYRVLGAGQGLDDAPDDAPGASPEDPSPAGAVALLRGNHRDGDNPRRVGMGDPRGPLMRFVDEFGETHWHRMENTRLVGYEDAPFVPRHLIDGRALLVFWPLDPRRDLYRLKWVH